MPPPRQIPVLSPTALSTSTTHRNAGTEAFKRGDYAAAHTGYSAALAPLPATHPLAIVLLCNRALTNIKIGDPKAAVADAEAALSTIGSGKGEGEKIDMGGASGGKGETGKDMKEFYGKAVMRKAEALEAMEKWRDAAVAWKLAVEAGVGAGVAIQGRNRCEKAAGIGAGGMTTKTSKSASTLPATRRTPAPNSHLFPKSAAHSALDDLTGRPTLPSHTSTTAVQKLREANRAAEAADEEKFALADQVAAKLAAWKGSKADNLIALLGSLDKVLWEGVGWRKVGMHELVVPARVKRVYQRAVGGVHPDKVCFFPRVFFAWLFLLSKCRRGGKEARGKFWLFFLPPCLSSRRVGRTMVLTRDFAVTARCDDGAEDDQRGRV